MTKTISFSSLLLWISLIALNIPTLQAQELRGTSIKIDIPMPTRGAANERTASPQNNQPTFLLRKEVPTQLNPPIKGSGKPTYMYVVQLARFEELGKIPATFPKGTFLWVNPDIPTEMLLLSGFYNSYKEAIAGANTWKKKPLFEAAFARKNPFMVRYD